MISAHPGGTLFHSSAWARVLHDTYGHVPCYCGRIDRGELVGLLPVMEVKSIFTGKRGVSLPFTDFCAPLSSGGLRQEALIKLAIELGHSRRWKYFECRTAAGQSNLIYPSLEFYGHKLDLTGGEEQLSAGLDGSVRRAIRKALSQNVEIEFANRIESMRAFYALHCGTRRRHGLPPQPWKFFDNIFRHVILAGMGEVVLARWRDRAVAGAVFFRFGRQAIYKFGASDPGFQHLRPNNLIMWEAIKRCAARGCATLHFGRTSLADEGLRRFKLGFGALEERIQYCRYNFSQKPVRPGIHRAEGWHNRVFRCLPQPVLRWAGARLYPHLS